MTINIDAVRPLIERITGILAAEIECGIFEDHVAPALAIAHMVLEADPTSPTVDHIGAATEKAPTDEPVERFLAEVRAELIRARSKFPGDRIMTIALAEEFGELCKALLDESSTNVRKEAVQTAVMCARVVLDGDGSVIAWRAERGLDPLVSEV